MKYIPHVLLLLAIISQYFRPDNFAPLIVAATIYLVTEYLNNDYSATVQTITERFQHQFDDHVESVTQHINDQQKVIESQEEIIERLRVTVGYKEIK